VKIAQAISQAKAYLIGNGIDKVLMEALNVAKSMPEEARSNPEFLKRIFELGVVKEFEGRRITIKLKSPN